LGVRDLSNNEAQQALAADSPVGGLFGKLRGRAAEAQRYAAENSA
jgi:hypothetical protein